MTLRNLSIFVKVCETESMTAAARELYISQPAVSHAVSELEGEYNIRLFERFSNRLHLTNDGRRLLSFARHILAHSEEIDREMRGEASPRLLRLGGTLTAGPYYLVPLIAEFQRLHQDPELLLYSHNTVDLEHALLAAELDVGVAEGRITAPELHTVPLTRDELVFVCGQNTPWAELARRGTITAGDLAGQPFLMREKGSGTQALFTQLAGQLELNPKVKAVLNSIDGIKEGARAGLGIAFLSRLAVSEGDGLIVLPLEGGKLERTFHLVWHRDKYMDDGLLTFLDFIRNGSAERRQ